MTVNKAIETSKEIEIENMQDAPYSIRRKKHVCSTCNEPYERIGNVMVETCHCNQILSPVCPRCNMRGCRRH